MPIRRRSRPGLFWGAFINNGQTCAALKRLYVHDDIYDDVCKELVAYAKTIPMGDGLTDDSQLGPVQNRMQFDKVARLVEAAKQGRRQGADGRRAGRRAVCSIRSRWSPASTTASAGRRGAVRSGAADHPLHRCRRGHRARQRQSERPRRLGLVEGHREGQGIGAQLECGTVWINKHGAIQPNAPFGGVKRSGFGVEFGEEGLFENTNVQVMYS